MTSPTDEFQQEDASVGPQRQTGLVQFMLLTGLMVGTLDATAAILDFMFTFRGNPLIAFQYIAGGILGAKTFTGGLATALLGIALHYCIAVSWTVFFFLLYPRVRFVRSHWILGGLLYAVVVWLVMNLGVRPLSLVPHVSWTAWKVVKGVLILMVAVGLPVSFTARQYFAVNDRSQSQTDGAS